MTALTVNGEPIAYALAPETPLVWALRDASNLTGTKVGCDDASCGACIVDIDGRAVRACSVTLATLTGATVTTIEGLSANRTHPVERAWLAENTVQCGFCDPGFIMATVALLRTNAQPSDDDIARALDGICRCGNYVRIRRAVHHAAAAMRPTAPVTSAASSAPMLSPG